MRFIDLFSYFELWVWLIFRIIHILCTFSPYIKIILIIHVISLLYSTLNFDFTWLIWFLILNTLWMLIISLNKSSLWLCCLYSSMKKLGLVLNLLKLLFWCFYNLFLIFFTEPFRGSSILELLELHIICRVITCRSLWVLKSLWIHRSLFIYCIHCLKYWWNY
jgi:hypothetical protein